MPTLTISHCKPSLPEVTDHKLRHVNNQKTMIQTIAPAKIAL